MMEFVAGVVFSPIAIGVLLLFSLFLDHNEHRGWTLAFVLATAFIAYKMYHPSLVTIGIIAAAWVPVGIAWAMWRWRRYCADVVKRVKNGDIEKESGLRRIAATDSSNTGKLVYWVIAWPISLIEAILGDVLDVIETLVTKVFKGTFAKISKNAAAEIDKL